MSAVRRFDTLLVANRGEIACRVMRTARTMGLRTVGVFTAADTAALHVGQADEAARITDYLDGDAIVAVALATGAEAIHPGYGFLAENPAFAVAVEHAGLVWIGPPAEAISAMGDKLQAKKLAEASGVPVLPSADDPTEFAALDFPILVKAVAGGGGKGMRIVDSIEDIDDQVAAARREAQAGFGDDRVFAERYVPRARHIEIQILGDTHGNLLHLGERECSIQRRHQKVIEESPSPFVTDAVRAVMCDAALRLGAAMSYHSTGTVEFLVDDTTGEFFFLEVNTRLQVEHPVTEAVTGIDLVREQLRIAAGETLDRTQDDVVSRGHATEARLYAEDPADDFLPATGSLEAFAPAAEPPVRWDAGVETGSTISVDFDPMIAKVIAHRPTRTEAGAALASALERLHIGGIVTNRDFLVATLRSSAFVAGETTTAFIDDHDSLRHRELSVADRHWLSVVAAMWMQGANRRSVSTLAAMPSGFRIGRLAPERIQLRVEGSETTVSYQAQRDGTFLVGDGANSRAVIHRCSDDEVDMEFAGRRRTMGVTWAAPVIHLSGGGIAASVEVVPRFSIPEPDIPGGSIAAPMPGKVIEIRVDAGDRVEAGQVVVVLEAMKMENHLRVPEAGTVVELLAATGDHVNKNDVLAVLAGTAEDGEEGPA